MKKYSILCIIMLLFVFGLNSSAQTDLKESDEGATGGGGDECEMTQQCADVLCSILNAKKRFLRNGCIKKCDYTCTVQAIPTP